jgi:hypothetical protein
MLYWYFVKVVLYKPHAELTPLFNSLHAVWACADGAAGPPFCPFAEYSFKNSSSFSNSSLT